MNLKRSIYKLKAQPVALCVIKISITIRIVYLIDAYVEWEIK
ncbi:hypothetical protein [Vibrio gallaecicus]|nr:hypothetical protein [Vibrio gallaecicus]MDN3616059.1 hypothetical protein [Vibrio gallaecicus]